MTKPPGRLGNFILHKTASAALAPPADALDEEAAPAKVEDPRQRVGLRLHMDAIEALEDIARQRRRETGRAVPTQELLEEAIGDFFAKNGITVEVKPAPAKTKARAKR